MNQSIKPIPTSTVNRSKAFSLSDLSNEMHLFTYEEKNLHLCYDDSLNCYQDWDTPTVIISDGAYGVLGFDGDTSDHFDLPKWYEEHIKAWSQYATPQTTLWFWNTEIGWASVHPILEKYGWKYVSCNIWNKGKGHIAGNVNTSTIRRFPVASEVCVQYVFEAKIDNKELKYWLKDEWKRTGLPLKKANEACGVKDAAVRKYLDTGHLWYFPPKEMFVKLVEFANTFGNPEGKPYFSMDGIKPLDATEWSKMRAKFHCPHGYTNIWERTALRGQERIKAPKSASKSAHLNQKPLDLMSLIIEASSDSGDVIWEPFGGLFSGSIAASMLNRKAFGAEIDEAYYQLAIHRIKQLNG